ncbi:hypothetical protein CRG98_030296 [Punica granatum]|uniref:Uncharacterized protein n=1 Tax=Punica granatum TaxID=22663 RepID=A0A2I0IZE1_PUNGR|nr:hypothetical protein CRG98_030296 [Punica granatum]
MRPEGGQEGAQQSQLLGVSKPDPSPFKPASSFIAASSHPFPPQNQQQRPRSASKVECSARVMFDKWGSQKRTCRTYKGEWSSRTYINTFAPNCTLYLRLPLPREAHLSKHRREFMGRCYGEAKVVKFDSR